jgi:aarF domain-containing kinase
MFPYALCIALSELHADAPSHSWKITQRSVEESLCIPRGRLFEVFRSFEREPVASGSIAQIHRAVIKPSGATACDSTNLLEKVYEGGKESDSGKLVAIKVRHPKVARLIDMDFRIMAIVGSIIDCMPGLGWLQIKSSIDQFSHTMASQAHLHVEAHHLEVLNYNFRNWDTVGFPKPLFACSKVIIETFEEGKICTTIIDQYDRLAAKDELTAEEIMPIPLAKFIVTTGLALYLKMLIIDGLMHADLHPGNIMISAELFDKEDAISSMLHSKDESPKHAMKMVAAKIAHGFYGHITLVDAGMVAQLEDQESANFIGLMSSLGAGDGRTAAQSVLKFSDKKDYLTKEEQEAFTKEMILFFEHNCKGYGTNVDVGEVLRGVLNIIKNHRVRIDANYATLVVNALCIEGLAKRVCPSYNVLDAAKPLLSSYRSLPFYKSKSRMVRSTKSLIYALYNLSLIISLVHS